MPSSNSIQRIYLTLMLGNTLAASFIWGINTIFLLDAGLSNLEAFAANAFFTAGMVLFEVPTGVVADTIGRRVSYLAGTVTLMVTTLLYVMLWQIEGPFWAWASVSLLLGLGFTFFSGAVEAWLVDALEATGYEGTLESIFGRGQIVTGIGTLTGSVAGGFIAQLTSLGVPFVMRAAVLLVMFGFAFTAMKDVGFTPKRSSGAIREMKTIAGDSIEYGWRVPSVKWIMLASPFTAGVGFYAFYALQPYLLELAGEPEAYGIAGDHRGSGRRGTDRRRHPRSPDPRDFPSAHVRPDGRGRPRLGRPGPDRRTGFVLGGDRADRGLGDDVRRVDADSPVVHQRNDPVRPAGHDPLIRLDARLRRRGRFPAGAGPGGRLDGVRQLLSVRRGDLGGGPAVHLPLTPPAARRRRRRRRLTVHRTRASGNGVGAVRAANTPIGFSDADTKDPP